MPIVNNTHYSDDALEPLYTVMEYVMRDLRLYGVEVWVESELPVNRAGMCTFDGQGEIAVSVRVTSVMRAVAGYTTNRGHFVDIQYAVMVAAHELRHAWQIRSGRLVVKPGGVIEKWKGDWPLQPVPVLNEDDAAGVFPWDIDANSYARDVYQRMVSNEQGWAELPFPTVNQEGNDE